MVLGILLGLNGWSKIWALFGSANQLLAALALLAVSSWLANAGKKNKMLVIPMVFMLVVTISSLFLNTKTQITAIVKGGADWGAYAQVFFGVMLMLLAVVLAVEGVATLGKKQTQTK